MKFVKHSKCSSNIQRFEPKIEKISNEALNFNPYRNICQIGPGKGINSPLCEYGDGELKAIVVGDSHANSIVSVLPTAINGKAIELTYSGYSTILGLKKIDSNDRCEEFNTSAITIIKKYPEKTNIIIVNRLSTNLYGTNEKGQNNGIPVSYFDIKYDSPNSELNRQFKTQLIKTMCSINNPSRVYLMRPIPEMGIDIPNTMVRSLIFGKSIPEISISLEEYHARHKVVWAAQDAAAKQCGVNILDPLPYLCSNGRCWGSKNGQPIYYDDDHLSEYGNKLLIPMFKQILSPPATGEQ